MAYTDRNTSSTSRVVAIAGVAVLHAAGIAALVNGLSFAGVIEKVIPITARNIPMDIPDPVPPPPQPEQSQAAQPESRIDALPPVKGVELNTSTVAVDVNDVLSGTTIPDFPSGDAVVAQPLPPLPGFTPKFARPLGNPGRWVTPDDYPAGELRAEHEGTTRFRVTVGSDGKVSDCQIVESSGWPVLDATACRKIADRARFAAATDSSGKAVIGSFTSNIRWVIPD